MSEGGDPACWVARVCERCGAVVESGHSCASVVRLDELAVAPGPGGAVWSLEGVRQLDVNLVILGAAEGIGEHHNDEVDVIVVVLSGAGRVSVDRTTDQVGAHDLVLVPARTTRAIRAGDEGMRYLSIHRARGGPAIQTRSPSR